MGIQEIAGKSKESIQEYQSKKRPGNAKGFQQSLLQNLKSKDQENTAEMAETERKSAAESGAEVRTDRNEERTSVGVPGSTVRIRINEAAGRYAVQTAEVRRMSYEESDHIEIAVTRGYTLKGKLEGQQVYVEAKYEDGRMEAYYVDTGRVQGKTQHRIEQFALETADSVKG